MSTPILQVKGLQKAYQDGALILKGIDLEVQQGEFIAVIGLSGAGKSTMLRCLNGLIEPTAGQILIDGTDVTGLSPEGLRRLRQDQMTMVFQKFALLPHRTVLENAALALEVKGVPLAERSAEAMKWLERVGLGKFADSHPHRLSGGMQQRVGIARALASNAPILLMDEAFSALDPLIRTDMQNLLLQLQTELHKTIIFISHDLDEALKLADHLVILKDGCVVQQGDPQMRAPQSGAQFHGRNSFAAPWRVINPGGGAGGLAHASRRTSERGGLARGTAARSRTGPARARTRRRPAAWASRRRRAGG